MWRSLMLFFGLMTAANAADRSIHLEESIDIARSVSDVFVYLNDIEKEREWQPWVRKVASVPEGQVGVGTVRWYENRFMGRRIINEYLITEYVPNERVAYITTPAADVSATGETRFEAVSGGTRVTLVFTPQVKGFFALMSDERVEAIYRKALSDRLAEIKALLEA